MTLIIVADIRVSSSLDLVKAELLKLVAPTHKESGCIQYQLHQDNEDPKHFIFYEEWKSQADLTTHFETKHMKDFMAATKGKVEVTINKMSKV